MKRSFKVLENLSDRRVENPSFHKDPMDLCKIVLEESDINYFRSEIFDEIYTETKYAYLALGGLYVAKDRLKLSENIRNISSDYIDFTGHQNGDYIINLSWHQAKKLASDLNARIMTPAEFFNIIKRMDDTGVDQDLQYNLTSNGREWLDAYMVDNAHMSGGKKQVHKFLSTHTYTQGDLGTVYGGNISQIEEPISEDWFDFDSIDWFNGIPTKKGAKKEFRYSKTQKPGPYALRRTTAPKEYAHSCSICKEPADEGIGGIRLCYQQDDINKITNSGGVGL